MTRIRQQAFSQKIIDYLNNPESFNQQKFDSSLYREITPAVNSGNVNSATQSVKVIQGLCFSDHIEVVMLLLGRAFRSLRDSTSIEDFSRAVSKALQTYAEPIADGDSACFPYPYFLMHGLEKPTVEKVVLQLEDNGRIIHETLAARAHFIKKYGSSVNLDNGLKMLMEEGATEDTSGICCYLARVSEQNPHGTDCSYIAKASFFLDTRDREVIVITLQGQRLQKGNRERSRDFARLGNKLHMDPRAYTLKIVSQIGIEDNYRKIKVIKPREHPMFHDNHHGFMARYEPVIREAGINTDNGCYLERCLA
jgi:hypothetical protein